MNQQVACEMLRDWGAHVVVAGNGREALDCLAAEVPDHFAVILMDIEMPLMDGRETTRRLRADPRYASLPIIAMTAHVAGHGINDSLAQGISAYIAKPFEPDLLLAMLQRYWGGDDRHVEPELHFSGGGDEAFVHALTGLHAIDAGMLLRRFSGRVPFLRRALRQFSIDYDKWADSFSQNLAEGDLETARRQVHTLKGLAGSFAMTPLRSALIVLEAALLEGRNLDAELDEVRLALSSLLPALAALPGDPAVIADVPSAGEPLSMVLERLSRQLHEGDGEAEEVWRQYRDRLSVLYNPRQIAAIDYAIGQWNFADALEILGRVEQGTGGGRE